MVDTYVARQREKLGGRAPWLQTVGGEGISVANFIDADAAVFLTFIL
jgi:hypothetical protein